MSESDGIEEAFEGTLRVAVTGLGQSPAIDAVMALETWTTEALHELIEATAAELEDEATARLTAAERKTLMRLLQKIYL